MISAFKFKLIESCKAYLEEKVNSLNRIIEEITEAAHSETKSSVGDKHETSRAMMQLEQEKLGKQMQEVIAQKAEFDKIDFTKTIETISQSALIESDKGLFFIAGAIGRLEVDGKTIFVISHQSPLALAFKGKKQRDTVLFNNASYTIYSVQ